MNQTKPIIPLKERLAYFAIGSILFLLFVLFSYVVAREWFGQIDFDLTVKMQDRISRRFDNPFSTFSLLGSVEVTSVIFILIYVLSLRKLHRLFIIATFPLFHIFELVGKTIVHHPGPPFMFHRYSLGLSFPSFYVNTDYSYPSGHVGRTVMLALIISFLIMKTKLSTFKKQIIWFTLAGICVVMAISRIYLGEHWFSDVAGGAILGASFAVFTAFLW